MLQETSMADEVTLMDQGNRHPNCLDEEGGGGESDVFDKPLPCLGCGIGWFSFILGFVFPPCWFYAGILYLINKNHLKVDLRERAGLAASAIAALICSVSLFISGALFLYWTFRP